jgi:hypothetical protein
MLSRIRRLRWLEIPGQLRITACCTQEILWTATHKIYTHVLNRGASSVRSPLDR